jgi:predicted nucleotide-binding protein (sugar kinase/HSP70/actin superfamily)
MRVAIPHMGNLYIPVKALFERLDIDYVIPPPNSQRTLSLGTKYSPEGLCIPFKLTLGNMIEAAELGADVLLMAAGFGICRLGYYAKTQEKVLKDLGYTIEVVKLGVSERKFAGFLQLVKRLSNNASWLKIISGFRFGMRKMAYLDDIEREVQKMRPREQTKGTINRLYAKAVTAIEKAHDYKSLNKVKKDYLAEIKGIPQDHNIKPLIVGIMGEFYVVLEPFSNLDIEKELGKLGVEVRRNTYISEWTNFSLFFGAFKKFRHDRNKELHQAALPYLKCDIGGDGWESVGEKVLYADKYDGLIHLAPFTCMPEIVAQNIMSSTKEKIPVLTVYCDEQMGKSGMMTRLEAFVDLLKRRRQKNYLHEKDINGYLSRN